MKLLSHARVSKSSQQNHKYKTNILLQEKHLQTSSCGLHDHCKVTNEIRVPEILVPILPRVRVGKPVSFWQENVVGIIILLQFFCENVVISKHKFLKEGG